MAFSLSFIPQLQEMKTEQSVVKNIPETAIKL